jgi:hypothetical protein
LKKKQKIEEKRLEKEREQRRRGKESFQLFLYSSCSLTGTHTDPENVPVRAPRYTFAYKAKL